MRRKLGQYAFEYYVALDLDRSYQAVAAHFGTSSRAVAKCAARERWQARLVEVERQAQEVTDRRLVELLAEARARQLAAAVELQDRALAVLQDQPMGSAVETVAVLDRALCLERALKNGHEADLGVEGLA